MRRVLVAALALLPSLATANVALMEVPDDPPPAPCAATKLLLAVPLLSDRSSTDQPVVKGPLRSGLGAGAVLVFAPRRRVSPALHGYLYSETFSPSTVVQLGADAGVGVVLWRWLHVGFGLGVDLLRQERAGGGYRDSGLLAGADDAHRNLTWTFDVGLALGRH